MGSDLARQAPNLSLLELGRQMGVIGGPEEAPFPLNVGLMMFNPEPWRFFPAMQIDVVWFPKGGPGGNKFSEKIFKGPIPRMTRDALDYIKRNLITETVIKHHGRAESTRVENFPYDAIEEAVVNAVYHRGYDTREPIEVRIEYKELFVISYPGPDCSVRLEQLRAGRAQPRRYRNRRIGEFLKELEFTEGRPTGIPKIMEAMANNGSPPAEFEFDEDHSYFMVRLPIHPAALEVAESQSRLESGGESTQSPTQSGLESETSRSVLMALAAGPLDAQALRKNLSTNACLARLTGPLRICWQKGLSNTLPLKSPIAACKNIAGLRTERAGNDLPQHPHRRRHPFAGHHPRFLLHDSPRETDLDRHIYNRYLQAMMTLSTEYGGTESAPIQYIITTTSRPPEKLRQTIYLQIKAHPQTSMLFDCALRNPELPITAGLFDAQGES